MAFKIDRRLLADSHLLFSRDHISYLLHANADVLWCILVPHTKETEFYRLQLRWQRKLCAEMNRLSNLLRDQFHYDKINLATFGNRVEQLQVHIVARHRDDAFWPDVIWGQPVLRRHSQDFIRQVTEFLRPQVSASQGGFQN
jgi:diadenosine tetraphosphate (Ap4A) HIT family hydrolase